MLKKILKIVGVVIVIFAAALFAIPYFFKDQIKEKPDVKFNIEQFPFFKPAVQSFLFVWLIDKGESIYSFSANQCHIISISRQGCADPYHSLVKGKVVGNCKIDRWQYLVFKANKGIFIV